MPEEDNCITKKDWTYINYRINPFLVHYSFIIRITFYISKPLYFKGFLFSFIYILALFFVSVSYSGTFLVRLQLRYFSKQPFTF